MFKIFRLWTAMRPESGRIVNCITTGVPLRCAERASNGRLSQAPAAALRQALGHAADFASRERPGVLARTWLADRVRWSLRDRGYPVAFTEDVAAGLVVAMGQPEGRAHE